MTHDGAATDVGLPGRRDGLVAVAAFGLCLLGGVVQADGTLASPPVAAYVVAFVCGGAVLGRRRAPVATMAVTTVGGMLAPLFGLLLSPLIVAPSVIAAYSYSLVQPRERRVAVVVSLCSAALLLASTPLVGDLSWQDASRIGTVAAFPLAAAVLGHSVQSRRVHLAGVEDRARRAEQEVHQRVIEERVRIARELHDLVAHQITLANAQATVAAHLFTTDPAQTRKSLDDLVGTTRNALDDLRATVGLLRQSGDAPASADPAPGVSRLTALAERFRQTGLEVIVQHDGSPRSLPPAVDLTVYRITQEALTNVTKHAGVDRAQVHLDWKPDCVIVEITDAGKGSSLGKPGYGLIGMRERATAVGGRLSAGPRPEGGFRVTAHLPAKERA